MLLTLEAVSFTYFEAFPGFFSQDPKAMCVFCQRINRVVECSWLMQQHNAIAQNQRTCISRRLGFPHSPRSRRICSGGPAVCPLSLANHTVSRIAQDMVVRCKVRYLRIKQYLHRMRRLALDPGCAQCCCFFLQEAKYPFLFSVDPESLPSIKRAVLSFSECAV